MYIAYSIHTTYVHTCTCYTCMLHTQYIHIACMLHTQKLAQRHTHTIQAYEEMYAVCVQLFTCSMYAVHKQLHVCSTHAIQVYYMCSMRAAYMHSMCSKEADICAAHKQHFCKGSHLEYILCLNYYHTQLLL